VIAKDKKTIAVVMYPDMTALDLVGAMETLTILKGRKPTPSTYRHSIHSPL
jgi:hypothetical protein